MPAPPILARATAWQRRLRAALRNRKAVPSRIPSARTEPPVDAREAAPVGYSLPIGRRLWRGQQPWGCGEFYGDHQ